jgi:hypothetical protein
MNILSFYPGLSKASPSSKEPVTSTDTAIEDSDSKRQQKRYYRGRHWGKRAGRLLWTLGLWTVDTTEIK